MTASRSLGKQDRDEPRGGAIVGALVGTTAVGVSNLTLGVQRDQTRLRMTGLVELGAQARASPNFVWPAGLGLEISVRSVTSRVAFSYRMRFWY